VRNALANNSSLIESASNSLLNLDDNNLVVSHAMQVHQRQKQRKIKQATSSANQSVAASPVNAMQKLKKTQSLMSQQFSSRDKNDLNASIISPALLKPTTGLTTYEKPRFGLDHSEVKALLFQKNFS